MKRFEINKDLPTPAYLQLKEKISQAIDTGYLPAGTALPSERDFAETLGLSRMTVRRAFDKLVIDRLIEQRQGSGTYVLAKRVEQTIDRVLGFTDEALNLGIKPGSVLLETRKEYPNQEVRKALQIDKDVKVLSISRIRTANKEPLALQLAYLKPSLSNLSLELLSQKGSLYKALHSQFGIKPHRARQSISAKLPNKKERQLLNIGPDVPMLALERITLDIQGQPFEYVQSSYQGDLYRMHLDLRAP